MLNVHEHQNISVKSLSLFCINALKLHGFHKFVWKLLTHVIVCLEGELITKENKLSALTLHMKQDLGAGVDVNADRSLGPYF